MEKRLPMSRNSDSKSHSPSEMPLQPPPTASNTMTNRQSSVSHLTSGSGMKSLIEMKETSRKTRAECNVSESTSHTQFFKKPRHENIYKRITRDQYLSISESMSGSSDSFRCIHRPEGKVYTEEGLLKRNLVKNLDPIPNEKRWTQPCKPACGWDIAEVLVFIIQDPTNEQQKDRLETHLKDFVKISNNGYKMFYLDSVCVIISYLIETLPKNPHRKDILKNLLLSLKKPVLMNSIQDVVNNFYMFADYLGFMGYLLLRLEDDAMFDIVSEALIWHLSAPDKLRDNNGNKLQHTLTAAAPMLVESVVRMLALATSHRFPTFLIIALFLACNSADNCLEMMKINILENIFYRFNPYFPDRTLPVYDINPADPQDINVVLGDSSVHLSTTLSLILILLKTTKDLIDKDPKIALLLPAPDNYAQRCFIWVYRYECRARGHKHERKTLTSIANVLVYCFGSRLKQFSEVLMPDILSLCVKTEVPPRENWTDSVGMNVTQEDVQFKKMLICFSVTLIKKFPLNRAMMGSKLYLLELMVTHIADDKLRHYVPGLMVMLQMLESRHYLLGLMYLLDPGLCYLRAPWPPSLFAELRKTSLQALVCAVRKMSPNLVHEYGLIRRIMWYIEWYSESPYELNTLYWCLRLLHASIYNRSDNSRQKSIRTLFDTHGIIIIIHLCYTLLNQKTPPVERAQAILALCLRLLTSAVGANISVTCCVYPHIKWPRTVNKFATTMIDVVLYSLEQHFIIGDRWLISLLNFIWEAIIWNNEFREKFIVQDGIYKLLDIVTLSRPPVQCIALALICDATKAGDAVGQLVTWRANLGASCAHPVVVKSGATIATLLASLFRDDCRKKGIQLTHNGVLEDMESPIMSADLRNYIEKCQASLASNPTPVCMAASEIAGSRMSKAYAIMSMLTEDLEAKVSLADENYNLYKNIQLNAEDEAILVLCIHYLTLKLNEVWVSIKRQSNGFLRHDEAVLEEFLHIGRGWAKEVKRQQEEVLEKDNKKETEEENSLYEFLARVRLNMSLDALKNVSCVARSADHEHLTHAMLHDAVHAHQRRTFAVKALGASVIRTYGPPLDDQNITGQNVKVYSIHPKDKPKPLLDNVSLSL